MQPIKITKTKTSVERDYLGVTLKIGRANSTAFVQKFRNESRPYKSEAKQGTLPAAKEREIMCRAMSGTVLLGWSGLKDENGEEIPFTEENGASLLYHDPDAREFVSVIAGEVDSFLEEETSDIAKKP